MIEYNYSIDMTPGRPPIEIPMKQFDSDFFIVFNLVSRKGELDLETGTTARIRGTKSDGYGYSVAATIDLTNKTVTAAGDEQMTAVVGRMPFELAILKGTKVLSTATFFLKIYPAALSDDAVISESEISDFRQAIEAAQQASTYETQAAGYASAASGSATEAASSAAAAAQSAVDAANVFQIVGNVSFIVNADDSVTMKFTETE